MVKCEGLRINMFRITTTREKSELPREQNKTFGPKKSMEPRTAAILGSANTLNFALNFKSGKNNFQNPPICWPIHPLLEVLLATED